VTESVEPSSPSKVAVIAHRGKTLGGGLDELRRLLAGDGFADPLWYEVAKSRKAPRKVRQALANKADLIFVWGGDGMVQRCADALVGSQATMAIVPAGTANLLAGNLGIPRDVAAAVGIGLRGQRRSLDLGRINGEHFVVMAGVGFDADMIRGVDGGLKDRLGRAAYVWTSLRSTNARPTRATVKLDGRRWFKGEASCVLIGNVGSILGGVEVFNGARPDDGWLDVGVSTAKGPIQWARTLARVVAGPGPADRSPFIHTTRAKRIAIKLDRSRPYELDGGSRRKTARVKVRVVPDGLKVCVPTG
jgi:diacylglycerol kinase (ATP)